jgi:tetratricopeptide (TPR) repeat protein
VFGPADVGVFSVCGVVGVPWRAVRSENPFGGCAACGTRKHSRMRSKTVFLILGVMLAFFSARAENKAYDSAINKATKALAVGNFAEADKQADAAEKIEPSSAQTANLRGVISVQKKDYDGAVNRFTQAIAADEKFYPAKLNLADVLLLQSKYADARSRYEELQQIDPKSELLQFKIVVTDVLDNREPQALELINQMTFPGTTPAYYFARAAVLLKNSREKEAQQYFTNARKYYDEQQCTYFVRFLQQNGLAKPAPKRTP